MPALLLSASCAGEIRSPGARSEDDRASGDPGSAGEVPPDLSPRSPDSGGAVADTGVLGECAPDAIAPEQPALLLTRSQYVRAVSEIFGAELVNETELAADATPGQFVTSGYHRASADHVRAYQLAAEGIAVEVTTSHLAEILPCATGAPGAECGRTFLEWLLPRAFRRTPSTDETGAYTAFFERELESFGFIEAVSQVTRAVLQAPQFLYRLERTQGSPGADHLAPIDGNSLAVRLSFFLTGTIPDAILLDAAGTGQLGTPAQIEQQARRLIASEQGTRTVQQFFRQWLHLRFDDITKGAALIDGLEDLSVLGDAWEQSFDAFVAHSMSTRNGSFEHLLSSSELFIPEALSTLYGDGPRAGLLTQPGIMALLAHDHSSPVLRGVFVREGLLCAPMPPPPANADINVPPAGPTSTTRDRYAQIESQTACMGCHSLIHGVGFAFENYDALGRHRDAENGVPVDVSGQLLGFGDPGLTGRFAGAEELAKRLAESRQFAECVTRSLYSYAVGRELDGLDHCTLRELSARLADASTPAELGEVLVSIATSERFRQLAVSQP